MFISTESYFLRLSILVLSVGPVRDFAELHMVYKRGHTYFKSSDIKLRRFYFILDLQK